jgi:hypothetical protein
MCNIGASLIRKACSTLATLLVYRLERVALGTTACFIHFSFTTTSTTHCSKE